MGPKGYRLLPHMSDAMVEAWASTLPGAFSQAAAGMLSVITDLRKVRSSTTTKLDGIQARDLEALLYSWLESILIKFETDGLVVRSSEAKISKSEQGYLLSARLRGEKLDPSRHKVKREVKAVTYHAMEVVRRGGLYRLRFLLDL